MDIAFSIVDEQQGYASAGLQAWVDSGACDPARQMDNSGMLSVTGEGEDADVIGASGGDRNENR